MPFKKNTNYLFLMLLFLTIITGFAQNSGKFKVVLDAGHGGKDPGAVKNGVKEKDVVLDVVLKIGKILEKNKEIEVIYTRKTDVFVELRERANIANKAKANLFISVHCNSVKSGNPIGAMTLVMGMSRTGTNLEIAKTENAVIFQETDYKTKYKGFDPNNPETLIGLKIIQEESLLQSIELATLVQNQFRDELKRKDKGVHQQPLWVLDATVMPGVLIVEAFGQSAAALTAYSLDPAIVKNKLVYLMTVNNARFRNPVMPDCELKLKVEAIRSKGKVWKYTGVAMVNDKIMADSEWMATIVDRKD